MINIDDKYKKLKNYIANAIKSKLEEIQTLEKTEEKNNKVKEALEKYNNGIFDENLLIEIIGNKKEVEEIAKIYSQLSFLVSPIFVTQKEKCQKRVDDFFKKIESDFLRKNTVYTSSHLKKCRDDVVMLEEINQKLSDNVNVGIIGTPALVAIDELLKDNKVVPKDRLDVIFNIAKMNVSLLNQQLEKQKKQTLEQEKEESKIEKISDDTAEIEETPIVKLQDEEALSPNVLKIYNKLLDIVEKERSQMSKDQIDVWLSQIFLETPVKERIVIYNCVSDLAMRKSLILADIKYNILTVIDKDKYLDDNQIQSIEKIISIYNEINLQLKKKPATLYENLDIHKMKKEKELLEAAEKLELMVQKFTSTGYNMAAINSEAYSRIWELTPDFEGKIEAFKTSLEIYFEDYDDADVKIEYNKLKKLYDEISIAYNTLYVSSNEKQEKSFYDNEEDVKNVVILLPFDETEESVINDDIVNDTTFKPGYLNSIISTLNARSKMSNHQFDVAADHKVHTDNYTEDFLKKYHVRSISSGAERIIYTRFNTNILPYISKYKENPHVMVVLALASSNEASKENNFALAMKRCYDASSEIDKMVSFLNPNWDTMSSDEKNRRKAEIEKFLSVQNSKLNNLIETVNKKNKGGRKLG